MSKTNFDINRHILLQIDEEKKIIYAFLGCTKKNAVEKFRKSLQALSAQYSGYTVHTEGFPLQGSLYLFLNAKI